jgi:hypothetical protein
MADNVLRIKLNNTWQDLNTLSGIAAGTATKVQRIGGDDVDIAISAAIPTTDVGERLQSGSDWYAVAASESAVWAKCANGASLASATVSFQENV